MGPTVSIDDGVELPTSIRDASLTRGFSYYITRFWAVAVALHHLLIAAVLHALAPLLQPYMTLQVGVYALALTHEPSVFECRAVSQEPCDSRGEGTTVAGPAAAVPTSIPCPPSSPSSIQEPNPSSNQSLDATQESCSVPTNYLVRDPAESVWDYSIPVPGSRQGKNIYPKAPVELEPWGRKQCNDRFVFVKNALQALVDKHLDLHGLERRPVYTSRMVGVTPSTAFPSIVVTCRDVDLRALQNLFRSRANTLHIRKGSTLAQWRGSLGKRNEKGEQFPRLRLVYYATRTSTVIRSASEGPIVAYVGNDGVYCGGLVQYQDASATLGPSISIDSTDAILTVGHLFSLKRPLETPLANGEGIVPLDGSDISTVDDDIKSMNELWDDDDEYDILAEGNSPHPNYAEQGSLLDERTSSGSSGPEAQTLAGGQSELWERVVPPLDLASLSPYWDWALVRPISRTPLALSRPNSVFLDGPEGRHILLEKVRHRPPSHLASVYMVSGVRGVLRGQLLAGLSFLPSSHGQDDCEAWTVILERPNGLISGECGSVVIDRTTNEVYGHVVGSDPLGHAYVVPLAHVLHQVKVWFCAEHVGLTPAPERSAPQTSITHQNSSSGQTVDLTHPDRGSRHRAAASCDPAISEASGSALPPGTHPSTSTRTAASSPGQFSDTSISLQNHTADESARRSDQLADFGRERQLLLPTLIQAPPPAKGSRLTESPEVVLAWERPPGGGSTQLPVSQSVETKEPRPVETSPNEEHSHEEDTGQKGAVEDDSAPVVLSSTIAIPDTQLGLTAEEILLLREAQAAALDEENSSLSRAANRALSQGHLLLDSSSLAALGRHFYRLMDSIERQIDFLSKQSTMFTPAQYDQSGNYVDTLDSELNRFHEILRQIDELEADFDRIQHVSEIIAGYRRRVEDMQRDLEGAGGNTWAGDSGRGGANLPAGQGHFLSEDIARAGSHPLRFIPPGEPSIG